MGMVLSCKLATALAKRLIDHLTDGCEQISTMGELRRKSDRLLLGRLGSDPDYLAECEEDTIGKFELLLLPKSDGGERASDHLADLDRYLHEMVARPKLAEFVRSDTSRAHDQRQLLISLPKRTPIRCDLFTVAAPDEWPTALVYRTGSKRFVEWLGQQASGQRLDLQDNGLWRGTRQIALADEQDLFSKLGIPFVPPSERGSQLLTGWIK